MLFSVVVLYKPDNLIKERLLSIANESDFLYVVVNQSAYPDDLLNLTTNSKILLLGDNLGLAKALNLDFNHSKFIKVLKYFHYFRYYLYFIG
jgi:hypothetical protein